MILTKEESQITSQVLKRVFDADISPDQIKGIQVHQTEVAETVVVVTSFALYSLGKAYFKQLVTELKPVQAAPVIKKPTRKADSVTLLSSSGASSIYEVIGETGNAYLVTHNSRTGYTRCGCKAASFGRGCYHLSAVKETVAKTDVWQQSQDELTAHIEKQAEAVAPVQRYRTPAERGIPSMKMERRSDEEVRAQTEEFLSRSRGVVVLADGTVAIDQDFYRMMGSVSQLRGKGMRELRKKNLIA